jgi:hypothetical protein
MSTIEIARQNVLARQSTPAWINAIVEFPILRTLRLKLFCQESFTGYDASLQVKTREESHRVIGSCDSGKEIILSNDQTWQVPELRNLPG